MQILSGGTPYIYVPVTGPLTDLTGFPVKMALVTRGTYPVSGDWKTAAWLAPRSGAAKEIAVQRDPAVWPDGDYTCYVQITASPELVPLRAGRVLIGQEL